MVAELSDITWRPVATSRLVLRLAAAQDEYAMWMYRHDERTARWLSSWPTERGSFHPATERPDDWASMVVIELAGVVIGNLLIRVEDPWAQVEVRASGARSQAELGWVLHLDYTGQGYATEAVEAALVLCFDHLHLHLRRVVAGCYAANTASWKLMERVGMRREQHAVADALHRSGRWMDSFGYALLADEWRARQRGLARTPKQHRDPSAPRRHPQLSRASRAAGERAGGIELVHWATQLATSLRTSTR